MIEKHHTIINLTNRLKVLFDFSTVEFVNYWDADLCTIGLRQNEQLIYINTFNYIEEAIPRFDYVLEKLGEPISEELNIIKECSGIIESELIFELTQILKLNLH
ncbi:MAG TPA: hypothetical protein VGE24_16820 [Emticicia sp.]